MTSATAQSEPVLATEARESSPTGGWLRAPAVRAKSGGLLRHLLGSAAVILGVLTVTFLVTRVFAPDPTSLFLAPNGNGFSSPTAAAAEKKKVEAMLGLGKPIVVEYYRFLDQLAHGNLGTSFQTGRPVTSDLLARLPATAELAVYALLLGVILGVLAGAWSAVRQGGLFDHVTRFVTIGGLALPQFWLGLMLLWLFFTKLHIAPAPVGRLPVALTPPRSITGFYVVDAVLGGQWHIARAAAAELALPVITLGLGLAAPLCKLVRSSMIEVLAADYVRTARAMGFGRRRIILVYALKNALLPVVTVLAGVIAYTFCGSVLVEGIFGWPGVGNYALQSIQDSDFPAIQGFVLYAAVLYIVVYSLLDYAYTRIDPRIRS